MENVDYAKWDYVPGNVEKKVSDIPYGFEYWDKTWKLEERVVNGRKVKVVLKPEPVKKEVSVKVSNFKCNTCDFETLKEDEIKIHVEGHKKAVEEFGEIKIEDIEPKKRGRPAKKG